MPFALIKNKIISLVVPFMLLSAGLYLVPLQIFNKDFLEIPGDFGDARFNNYILEHGYKYIKGDIKEYWNAPFMFPYKNVIAFSDNLLGTVPIYSIFRLLDHDRETAFQYWLLSLFTLNFICCFYAMNKWSDNPILSATGAYIFTFSIFIIGHIYNVQNFPRFIIPLIFYWGWKYLSQKKIKYFFYSILGVVFQFYCGIYLGFFLVYTLLFFLIGYLTIYRDWELIQRFSKIKVLAQHLLAFILAVALLTPLMIPYIEISQKFGMRNFEDAFNSIPTIRSYFFTSKASLAWTSLSEHGIDSITDYWCHYLFIGILPWLGILLTPLALISKKIESGKRKFIGFIFLGLCLSFIFCLKIGEFSLYKVVFMLPGFSSMRSINRVINSEIMFFIILFVVVFNEFTKGNVKSKWVLMSFPFLIIIDNLITPNEVMKYNKAESQVQIETLKNQILSQYDKKYDAISYIPSDLKGKEIDIHLGVMLAAQELNIPCVNAYTGSHPGEYNDYFSRTDDEALTKWCNYNKIDKTKIQNINDLGKKEEGRKFVFLKGSNSKFLCATESPSMIIVANRENPMLWETFSLIHFNENKCALRSYKNYFLSAGLNQPGEVTASKNEIGNTEIFNIIDLGENLAAFKTYNGKYLSLEDGSFKLIYGSDSIGETEKFMIIPR